MWRAALELRNTIQPYAWGSRTAIAGILGRPGTSAIPQAEMWMGAHPKAPSQVRTGDGWQPLDRLIKRYPDAILGRGAADRFGTRLPFLFKVLAAAQPLSIQAHPSRLQAEEGFARENRAGIRLDDPQRNYRDDHHKPELICALTEFWALCGFRPRQELLARLRQVCPEGLAALLGDLEQNGRPADIRSIFTRLMTLGEKRRRALVDEVLVRAGRRQDEEDLWRWIARLGRRYPGDIGVLAPVLLNLVRLRPAEALFLPSGHLHAYLQGTGIELMANSDNVLRGGLTAQTRPTCRNCCTYWSSRGGRRRCGPPKKRGQGRGVTARRPKSSSCGSSGSTEKKAGQALGGGRWKSCCVSRAKDA